MKAKVTVAPLLQSFFTDRLMQQKRVSLHTVGSYRDTFRLLLHFVRKKLRKQPSGLILDEVSAPLIVEFLDELEQSRKISPRSRNLRLTAIRSFFRYLAYEVPTHSAQIQRVLAIPNKRFSRNLIAFLSREEAEALLRAPTLTTWSGRRDHALMLLALQTGLRLSELTGLQRTDLILTSGAHVRVIGKGRKERCTPLARRTVAVLKEWLKEPVRGSDNLVFTNMQGGRLSPDGVQYIVAKHVTTASAKCSSLSTKRVTPHVFRHYSASRTIAE